MDNFALYVQEVRRIACDKELVVLPSSEYLNTFLVQNRSDIEALGCRIPLVNPATYFELTNKESAAELFSLNGFSVPRNYQLPIDAQYPLIAKPRRNVAKDSLLLYPQFLNSIGDLAEFKAKFDEAEFFFQERVRGRSLYLLFYLSPSSDHAVLYSQLNLLQQPGGKSILMAVSAALQETELAQRVVHLLRQQGFHGLGMIEFIQRAEDMIFIEMNPRIWGPVQLCVDNGIPILEAFIGDAIHDDPSHFLARRRKPKKPRHYAWLGGIAASLSGGRRPVRLDPKHSWSNLLFNCARNDVYLRQDSWRCFLYDLRKAVFGEG